jgi:hypothetical protein
MVKNAPAFYGRQLMVSVELTWNDVVSIQLQDGFNEDIVLPGKD